MMGRIIVLLGLILSHKLSVAEQLSYPFEVHAFINEKKKNIIASSPIELTIDTTISDFIMMKTNETKNIFSFSKIEWVDSKYLISERGGNSFWDIVTISDVNGWLFPQAEFKFSNLLFSKDILLPFPDFLTVVHFMEFKRGNFIIYINVEFPEFLYRKENYILHNKFIFLDSKRSIVENFIYQIIWRNGISLDWLRK